MNKEEKYFASFYGELAGVRDTLVDISTNNPRCIETGELLLATFKSKLPLSGVSKALSKEKRLFSVFKFDSVSENVLLHFGNNLNEHLLNDDYDYEMESKVDMKNDIILKITELDSNTKGKIINELLDKNKKGLLSENEIELLKRLAEDEE